MGQPGSIATHEGYFDNTAQYRMTWYSTWADFGDPIRKAMLKRLRMTLYGALNQTVVFKWGFDYSTTQSSQPTVIADTAPPSEYAIGEYAIAEYSRNLILKELAIPGRGIGQVLQVGFESQIQGYPISIQKVDIFVKQGRV